MISGGFCTATKLKTLLGITTSADDTLIADLITRACGSMESSAGAGRLLRRQHGRIEQYRGGDNVIRVSVPPILKIHHVRESSVRDFDDPDNYTELTEGEDFVVEVDESGSYPGRLGMIRRLNGNWLGSRRSPAQVQVCYTGGYKTTDESALENTSKTLNVDTGIVDFAISKSASIPTGEEDYIYRIKNYADTAIQVGYETDAYTLHNRAIIRFATSDLILPTWKIISAVLNFKGLVDSGSTSMDVYIFRQDPKLLILKSDGEESIYELFDDDDSEIIDQVTFDQATFEAFATTISNMNVTSTINQKAGFAILQETIAKGFAAFGVRRTTESAVASTEEVAGSENATSGDRPTLVVGHRVAIEDRYGTPTDLEEANIMQAVHLYTTRTGPGLFARSTRGVGLSSGAAIEKPQLDLLPEVRKICQSYRLWL